MVLKKFILLIISISLLYKCCTCIPVISKQKIYLCNNRLQELLFSVCRLEYITTGNFMNLFLGLGL
jgi:hypothetical protein